MERIALLGTLKMKAIDWDVFTKKAKLISLKYVWNYVEEVDK